MLLKRRDPDQQLIMRDMVLIAQNKWIRNTDSK